MNAIMGYGTPYLVLIIVKFLYLHEIVTETVLAININQLIHMLRTKNDQNN